MIIKYLHNHEIDKERWDLLIDRSPEGSIYAYSWYLDIIAGTWGALVLGDYECVMPLPYGKKYGLHYILTPLYIQRLGLFSEGKPIREYLPLFLKNIPSKFKYIDLSLNSHEIPEIDGVEVKRRTNYILDMNRPYSEIRENYRSDAKKKLRTEENFRYIENYDISEAVAAYKKYNGPLMPAMKDPDFARFEKGMLAAWERDQLISACLEDAASEVLASGLFLRSHGKAYYIAGSQTENGRIMHASHFLLDHFFRKNCQQIRIFDFEGSDVPGIASFFKKWGSVPEYYPSIKIYRFPVNLFLK